MINTNYKELEIYKDPIFTKNDVVNSHTYTHTGSYNHSQSMFSQPHQIDKFRVVGKGTGNIAQHWKFRDKRDFDSPKLKTLSQLRKEHYRQIEDTTLQLEGEIFSQFNLQPEKPVQVQKEEVEEKILSNMVIEDKRLQRLQVPQRLRSRTLPLRIEVAEKPINTKPGLRELLDLFQNERSDSGQMPIFTVLHPIENIKESKDFPIELLTSNDVEQMNLFDSLASELGREMEMEAFRKPKYGFRWYVEAKKWKEIDNHSDEEDDNFIEKYKNDPEFKLKATQLSNLNSSRMFKEYLMRNKKNVPSWLKDVYVTKEANKEPQESAIPTALLSRYSHL